MAIYSQAVRTSNVTATNAHVEIIAGANTTYRMLEYGFTLGAATAGAYGFGQPAAIGVTPTSPVALATEDGGNTTTANTTSALAWGTSPTAPSPFSRRVSLPNTIGAGIVWTFPRGFTILKAKTLVGMNIATPAILDAWFVVDE